MSAENIARELGEISGSMKAMRQSQERTVETLDRIDERLRKVESRAMVNGAVTGGVMAVAIAFIKDAFNR